MGVREELARADEVGLYKRSSLGDDAQLAQAFADDLTDARGVVGLTVPDDNARCAGIRIHAHPPFGGSARGSVARVRALSTRMARTMSCARCPCNAPRASISGHGRNWGRDRLGVQRRDSASRSRG